MKKGEELFMTYCDITDITSLRRKKMFITKGFWCQCERCKDRTVGIYGSTFECELYKNIDFFDRILSRKGISGFR